MKYISHRGNLRGPDPVLENEPGYIQDALAAGFDVEIDVWYIDGKFFLGHDEPIYDIDVDFLLDQRLWCHAKTPESLEALLAAGAHCFWHESDERTLTNKGFVWTYPHKKIINNAVVVILDKELDYAYVSRAVAVCGDYVESWCQ
jgi:hypothetical protein